MEEKSWQYHVIVWFLRLLPVIIGVVFTVILVKILEKRYKGPDDEEN